MQVQAQARAYMRHLQAVGNVQLPRRLCTTVVLLLLLPRKSRGTWERKDEV